MSNFSRVMVAVLIAALSTNLSTNLSAEDRYEAPSNDAIRAILQRRIDVEKQSVGIAIGIIDSQGQRIVTYGSLRKQKAALPDGNTVFEIGSVSKVFTALLLADMVQRGEVKLDDPVKKYLPATVTIPARKGREITLLDLSNHTSALPRMPNNVRPKDAMNPYADYTVEQMYEFLSGYKLQRDIGEKYEYSNLATGLLGHILALRAGKDYETLLIERVCKPLGMSSTMIKLSDDARQRMAAPHNRGLIEVKNWDIPTLAGAGAIRSTVNDMLKFLEANMGLVKSPLADAMSSQLKTRKSTGNSDSEIAIGWHILKIGDNEIAWHNGETGGFHSFIGFDQKRGVGVVVLSNAGNNIDDIGHHLLDTRFSVKKMEPKKERVAIQIDPKILDQYVGSYELAPTFVIAVTKEKDRLMVQATGQPKFEVFPESEQDFFLKVVDAQITFVKDDKGQIEKLILHQNGLDQPAKRRAK